MTNPHHALTQPHTPSQLSHRSTFSRLTSQLFSSANAMPKPGPGHATFVSPSLPKRRLPLVDVKLLIGNRELPNPKDTFDEQLEQCKIIDQKKGEEDRTLHLFLLWLYMFGLANRPASPDDSSARAAKNRDTTVMRTIKNHAKLRWVGMTDTMLWVGFFVAFHIRFSSKGEGLDRLCIEDLLLQNYYRFKSLCRIRLNVAADSHKLARFFAASRDLDTDNPPSAEELVMLADHIDMNETTDADSTFIQQLRDGLATYEVLYGPCLHQDGKYAVMKRNARRKSYKKKEDIDLEAWKTFMTKPQADRKPPPLTASERKSWNARQRKAAEAANTSDSDDSDTSAADDSDTSAATDGDPEPPPQTDGDPEPPPPRDIPEPPPPSPLRPEPEVIDNLWIPKLLDKLNQLVNPAKYKHLIFLPRFHDHAQFEDNTGILDESLAALVKTCKFVVAPVFLKSLGGHWSVLVYDRRWKTIRYLDSAFRAEALDHLPTKMLQTMVANDTATVQYTPASQQYGSTCGWFMLRYCAFIATHATNWVGAISKQDLNISHMPALLDQVNTLTLESIGTILHDTTVSTVYTPAAPVAVDMAQELEEVATAADAAAAKALDDPADPDYVPGPDSDVEDVSRGEEAHQVERLKKQLARVVKERDQLRDQLKAVTPANVVASLRDTPAHNEDRARLEQELRDREAAIAEREKNVQDRERTAETLFDNRIPLTALNELARKIILVLKRGKLPTQAYGQWWHWVEQQRRELERDARTGVHAHNQLAGPRPREDVDYHEPEADNFGEAVNSGGSPPPKRRRPSPLDSILDSPISASSSSTPSSLPALSIPTSPTTPTTPSTSLSTSTGSRYYSPGHWRFHLAQELKSLRKELPEYDYDRPTKEQEAGEKMLMLARLVETIEQDIDEQWTSKGTIRDAVHKDGWASKVAHPVIDRMFHLLA